MTNAKQIALGCLALATIPAVAWFSFSYHVLVGVAVTLVYGSGAAVVATASIGGAVLSIASAAHDRARAREVSALPEARLLGDGKPR